MKALLDTCVLYPTVMRQVLLGAAREGYFTPLWSPRILGEWARAVQKLGAEGVLQAEAEIAQLTAAWPAATVTPPQALERRLWLPDPHDIHVLAAAVAGSADVIVTLNASDFPRNILAEEGLSRADPDSFLLGFYRAAPEPMQKVCDDVLAEARRLSGQDWTMRALLKKARLPRLAKAASQA